MGGATALLGVAVALAIAPQASLQWRRNERVVSYRDAAIAEWLSAVAGHVPGQDDEPLLVARRWTGSALDDTWIAVNAFVVLLENARTSQVLLKEAGRTIRVLIAEGERERTVRRIRDLGLHHPLSRNQFLFRAAVFHTDLALLDLPSLRRPLPASFLVPQRVVVEAGDGTQRSVHGDDINWEFARVVLDAVTDVVHNADVLRWYRATMAYKLSTEELDPLHFAHALQLFPDDAEVLFLNGCLHETFADPRVQRALGDLRLPPNTRVEIRETRVELREAERFFRRALEIDRAHHEARIRHGRTLMRLGSSAEAAGQLRTALRDAEEPILRYYASLFLGAAEEALGRFDEAKAAFQQALATSPRAAAPRLALSQLAYRTDERQTSRQMLDELLGERGHVEDDAWWTYRMSAGRGAQEAIDAIRRLIGEKPSGDDRARGASPMER